MDTIIHGKNIRYLVDNNLERYQITYSIFKPYINIDKLWDQLNEGQYYDIEIYGYSIPYLNMDFHLLDIMDKHDK
jgi:hypothetical protein